MTTLCETCGAKIVEYKHGLNKHLVEGLRFIVAFGGRNPVNLKTLNMPRTQWDNFQKLKYWGLVEQVPNPGGGSMADKDSGLHAKTGWWKVTALGISFSANAIKMPKFVWTYRGDPVKREGPYMYANEVVDSYTQRQTWAEEAVPHDD